MAESEASFLQRLMTASQNFGDLTKDSKNDYLNSSYLSLPGLYKSIKEPLLMQGIMITTFLQNGSVVTELLDLYEPGTKLSSSFPYDSSSIHKIGASVTYGTRYNLLALLAISPEDDDGIMAQVGGGQLPSSPPSSLPGGVLPGRNPYSGS